MSGEISPSPIGGVTDAILLLLDEIKRDCSEHSRITKRVSAIETLLIEAALSSGVRVKPRPINPVSEEAETYRAERGPTWCAIFDAMLDYRMSNMCFEGSDDGYCLVDLMSRAGASIDDGEWEMVSLADEILSAIEPTQAPSHAETVAPYAAALRMIRDAVGELFGPVSDLESEEAVLLRGPEPHHEAEAIIAGLQRVKGWMRETQPMRLHIDRETLKAQIEADPDDMEVEAGSMHPEAPAAAELEQYGDGGLMRNTHLIDWLGDAYGHCQHGSKEWCEGYLHNARDVIKAQDALLSEARKERDTFHKALVEISREVTHTTFGTHPSRGAMTARAALHPEREG